MSYDLDTLTNEPDVYPAPPKVTTEDVFLQLKEWDPLLDYEKLRELVHFFAKDPQAYRDFKILVNQVHREYRETLED